jgi:hypothetical protein
MQYQDMLHQMTQYFAAQGSSLLQAQQQAFAWIGQQVQTQATYLAYIDVFWVLTLISAGTVLLAFLLRKVKLGAAAAGPLNGGAAGLALEPMLPPCGSLAGENSCQGDSDTGSLLVGKVIMTRRISLMAINSLG